MSHRQIRCWRGLQEFCLRPTRQFNLQARSDNRRSHPRNGGENEPFEHCESAQSHSSGRSQAAEQSEPSSQPGAGGRRFFGVLVKFAKKIFRMLGKCRLVSGNVDLVLFSRRPM